MDDFERIEILVVKEKYSFVSERGGGLGRKGAKNASFDVLPKINFKKLLFQYPAHGPVVPGFPWGVHELHSLPGHI